MAKKAPAEMFETLPPQADPSSRYRSPSGVRQKVRELTEHARNSLMAVGIEELEWDEDTSPTGVESPYARQRRPEGVMQKVLVDGEREMAIPQQDLLFWSQIQEGVLDNAPLLQNLIPQVARSLIEKWDQGNMILWSLRVLDRSTARVLAEWKGKSLHIPNVKYIEPQTLEVLKNAAASEVMVGRGMLKKD